MSYARYNDERLVAEISKGNHAAFSVLYNRFFPVLYAYAFKLTKDRSQAEDVLQEIFISLWDNRKKLTISRSVSTYLYAAVRYQFYRLVARDKARQDVSAELITSMANQTFETDAALLHVELQAIVMSIAKALPGKLGEIFIKSRVEDLSNGEIAEKLDLSEKTIRNQLSLATRRIRSKLIHLPGYSRMVIILSTNLFLVKLLLHNCTC